MKRVVAAAVAAVVVAGGAVVAHAGSGHGSDERPQQQMNADNARRILDSPSAAGFALPTELPADLEYLFVTRTTGAAFEMAVQHRGGEFVLCDGDGDPESACDEPTVTVIRDEHVDGRRVRVAKIDLAAASGQRPTAPPASALHDSPALDFWRHAALHRGATPAWVAALARGEGAAEA